MGEFDDFFWELDAAFLVGAEVAEAQEAFRAVARAFSLLFTMATVGHCCGVK
jgi:hypothetical protein